MARSPLFAQVSRALRLADYCERYGLSTSEGLARLREAERAHVSQLRTRREWLQTVMRAGAAGVAAAIAAPAARLGAVTQKKIRRSTSASSAPGSQGSRARTRCAAGRPSHRSTRRARAWAGAASLRRLFPGQVAERGGEFIDNLHKTMLGYAQQVRPARRGRQQAPGDVFYYFDGSAYPEVEVVDEYRAFVARDARRPATLSREADGATHHDADVALDHTEPAGYLEGAERRQRRGRAGRQGGDRRGVRRRVRPRARRAELPQLPALHPRRPALEVHAVRRLQRRALPRRRRQRPHRDGLAAIAAAADPSSACGSSRVRQTSAGAIELTFDTRRRHRVRGPRRRRARDSLHRAARRRSRREPRRCRRAKRHAIDALGYGTNAKMMVGFNGRPWATAGGNGASYSDLANHQTTWETNPAARRPRAASSPTTRAARAARRSTRRTLQQRGRRVPRRPRHVYPGAAAAARARRAASFLAHLEHWPSNPLTRGSYTCYKPGQFTTIAGQRGQAGRQPLLRRRARQLVLRVAGLHGRRRAVGHRCGAGAAAMITPPR